MIIPNPLTSLPGNNFDLTTSNDSNMADPTAPEITGDTCVNLHLAMAMASDNQSQAQGRPRQ
jgi:hypothetical protein